MSKRRSSARWLAIIVILLVGCLIASCLVVRGYQKFNSHNNVSGPTHTEPTTGVIAQGNVDGGELKVTPHNGTPGFSTEGLIKPINRPVKVEPTSGTLQGLASITFPYPAEYDNRTGELFVARYNDAVRQWVPQGGVVNTQDRTITAYTTQFSYWSLARFDEESSAKQAKYMLEENFYSSTLYSGFSGLFSSPPPAPTGCTKNVRNGLKTIQADVSKLMRRLQSDVCVGRTPQGKYILSIGNNAGYPVHFQLPQGIKVLQVAPYRNNIFGVFVEQLRKDLGDSALVLRGGQRAVLEIEPDKVPDGTLAISAKLDFGHVFLDLSGTLMQLVIPLAPRDGVDGRNSDQLLALAAKQSQAFAKMVSCYTAAGQEAQEAFGRITKDSRVLPLLDMHNAIMKGLSSCSSELLAFYVEMLTDPVKWLGDQVGELTIEHIKNKLPELIKGRFDQLMTVWRDAGVFTQFFTSIFALIRDRGITTYTLTVSIVPGSETRGQKIPCADDLTHGGVLSPYRLFERPCLNPVK